MPLPLSVSKHITIFDESNIVVCRLRSIFVDERMSEDRAPGPSDEGAAMVMGHSTNAWRKNYDKRYFSRTCQNTVDAMGVWKQTMLDRAKAKQANQQDTHVAPSAPPASPADEADMGDEYEASFIDDSDLETVPWSSDEDERGELCAYTLSL